jgi:hypothetical protein
MNPKNYLNLLLILSLVSCGGGGGGGSSDPEQPSIFNPIINTFTTSSSSIVSGNSISLSWTTTNAIQCSGSGDWEGTKATGSGTETLTLSDVRSYTFTLTCQGESSQNTVSKSVTVEVTESNSSSANIYSEDKSSYCATPNNDSSSYWIEDFSSNILNDDIFTYQESNGFCATPGCPNGDSDYVNGWGNNEIQYYTSCRDGYSKNCNSETNTTENAFIEDGYLKIQPIYWNPANNQQPFDDPYCKDNTCTWGGTWDYTSARIMTSSKKVISPGSEITVCFKHPDGMGHWPAIWMLPQGFVEGEKQWPRDGENDLVEHMKNHQAYETQSTIHFGSNGQSRNIWKIESVPADVNFYDKFHSVTMKWHIDKIEYFLDTQTEPYLTIEKSARSEFNTEYWPFNNNFYLILNVASGGNSGGDPDTSRYCQDIECSNLDNKDNGRLLIDFIEVKSID